MPELDERDVSVLADEALLRVVRQVRDDQWDVVVPPELVQGRTGPTTLRELIGYHAYDDAWLPDMLAGRTMAEVGEDAYSGDLLGDDPAEGFAAVTARSSAAARELDDLDRTVHCSFGDFPAREYLWQVNSFRGLRSVALARFVGVDDQLAPALVQGLWDELSPRVEEWRAIGVFGPAVEVADDAPLQERLLGLVGHQPRA